MYKKLSITVVAAFLFLSSPLYAKDKVGIESFFLKNGMEVIVIPNQRIPAVSHTVWYKVGAADDPYGKSGLAHYHEHVMFLGTEKYKSGEYNDIIADNGGEHNAFTGRDATAYFVNIAKEKLPLVMQMEADRMQGIKPSDEDINKEKQVIIEERRMRIENNPAALLSEQIDAALFRNHPYRIPTIGWQHEMKNLSKQDVLDFHKKWYHPNNAILIISGDISADEVKPMAEKYYGDIPQAPVEKRIWNEEPPQNVERKLTLRHPQVSQPTLSRVYAASSVAYGNNEDALPLFILEQILGGGKTGKLYTSLLSDKKLASAVSVNYNGFALGPAEFYIELVPEQNIPLDTLENALDVELALFLKNGISDEELNRAKTLLKAETIFARDGLSKMANIMGWIRIMGLEKEYFNDWSRLVDSVSKEAVLAAAKNLIKNESSVTASLLPQNAHNIRSDKK